LTANTALRVSSSRLRGGPGAYPQVIAIPAKEGLAGSLGRTVGCMMITTTTCYYYYHYYGDCCGVVELGPSITRRQQQGLDWRGDVLPTTPRAVRWHGFDDRRLRTDEPHPRCIIAVV
jgi:hypothetical protein